MISSANREKLCAIYEDAACSYAADPPFHPSQAYPEYTFGVECVSAAENRCYDAVRRVLKLAGLDAGRTETAQWNPLADIISPGETVVIKPNFVLHFNASGGDVNAVVTHGSVIRPVLDYVLKALNGTGRVIVGDAPHGNADFQRIIQFTGIDKVVEWYRERGHNVQLLDFRKYRYAPGSKGFLQETRTLLSGDPNGYAAVQLDRNSELHDLDALERIYGADFDRATIRQHHNPARHEYLVSGSVLQADTIISMPKLKVHSKAGITVNLKNLVGINGDKNWLPHYRIGHPGVKGDEYPESSLALENGLRHLERSLMESVLAKDTLARKRLFRATTFPLRAMLAVLTAMTGNRVTRGGWSGNDTVWRMVLDLNRILLYADRSGVIQRTRQRKFFSLVDGIIAGEGDGPLAPTAKQCGVLMAGFNPVAVDLIAAKLMGFDPEQIALLKYAGRNQDYPLLQHSVADTQIESNNEGYRHLAIADEPNLHLRCPSGWRSQFRAAGGGVPAAARAQHTPAA